MNKQSLKKKSHKNTEIPKHETRTVTSFQCNIQGIDDTSVS